MKIRTDADIRRLRKQGNLTTGEETLIANCRAGEATVLGDGKLPNVPSDARTVRADLLRHLIVGGCGKYPTQDLGVDLTGAYVIESLDLNFARAKGITGLINCCFVEKVVALQARLEFLNLNGSNLPELNAQGIIVTGEVFLRDVEVKGIIRLSGAQIGGQVDCRRAAFLNRNGDALDAHAASVDDSVILRGIIAKGRISLNRARISGQLDCTGAHFTNAGGTAIFAQKLEVEELLLWEVEELQGDLNFHGAIVGVLVDDDASWNRANLLFLNGMTYRHIHGSTDTKMRLGWVARDGEAAGHFRPQPYEQLAKVFKAMGHSADARRVLIEKENLQRADERKRMVGFWGSLWWPFKASADFLLWLVVGYGYRPFRIFAALVFLWFIGGLMAHQAWRAGDFAPNSDVILSTPAWQVLAEDLGADNPAAEWSAKYGAGRDWETFHPAAYAFDIVVPIVTIGQTVAWAPSTTRGPWGWHLWWVRWVLTVAGWIVTAVGAAAITGIIRRE